MATVEEFCEALDYSQLKEQIGNFTLHINHEKTKKSYNLFHYENPLGWKWRAYYDYEVEDFTISIKLGLCEFKDISFIRAKGEDFWVNLLSRYERELLVHLNSPQEALPYAYRNRGIHTWEYGSFLPEGIGNFRLDVNPAQGIRGINGTYIIGEYVDSARRSGLILCYNLLRDEFFGELYKEGDALITHDLDSRNLNELEEKLKSNLNALLESVAS